MKTQVNIDEETKRKIIDLRNQHKKKIREIVEIVGKSSRDVTTVLKENEIQQAQTTKGEKKFNYNEKRGVELEFGLKNKDKDRK